MTLGQAENLPEGLRRWLDHIQACESGQRQCRAGSTAIDRRLSSATGWHVPRPRGSARMYATPLARDGDRNVDRRSRFLHKLARALIFCAAA